MPFKDRKKAKEWWKKYSKRPEVIARRQELKSIYKKSGKYSTTFYRRRARVMCIEHYSNGKNQCSCCGEKHMEFLAIDHIKGGGRKHQKEIKSKYSSVPIFLVRNNFPKGFRVLCHNCNSALGYYGYCPHDKEKGLPEGV
jgi:hypothetical protein